MAKYTFLEAEISHASQELSGSIPPLERIMPQLLQDEMETMMKLQADLKKLCADLIKLPEFEAKDVPEAYTYLSGKVEALTVNTGSDKVVLNGGSTPHYRPLPPPYGHWIEDWLQIKSPNGKTAAWELKYPKVDPKYKLYPCLRVRLSEPR